MRQSTFVQRSFQEITWYRKEIVNAMPMATLIPSIHALLCPYHTCPGTRAQLRWCNTMCDYNVFHMCAGKRTHHDSILRRNWAHLNVFEFNGGDLKLVRGRKTLTIWEVGFLAYLLRVRWEHWHHFHICMVNVKLQTISVVVRTT